MKTLTIAALLALSSFARADTYVLNADGTVTKHELPPLKAPAPSSAPTFRWDRGTPGQLSLWDGANYIGAWREADGVYLSYNGERWSPAGLPTPLPPGTLAKGVKPAASPFPPDTKTTTDAVGAAKISGAKPAPVQLRAHTGTSAPSVGLRMPFGIGTSSRVMCVGRT